MRLAETDRSGPHKESHRGELVEESRAVLRAKYLDYCSAQVADILLLLTADEMFVLAQDAARESGFPGDLSYGDMVRLATERVSVKLGLPPLEQWIAQYQEDPDRFDPDLMGLWRSEVEEREA